MKIFPSKTIKNFNFTLDLVLQFIDTLFSYLVCSRLYVTNTDLLTLMCK